MDLSSIRRAFRRPSRFEGERLAFRLATREDAEFILKLRLDPAKNRYLSPVPPSVEVQRRWLEATAADPEQLYFIIQTKDGKAVGAVRLYNPEYRSFTWGSWILSGEAPKSSAVESTLMVYHLGRELGFETALFDVRRDNEKVWQYHERMGARRIQETGSDIYYIMDASAIDALLDRYKSRLPNGVLIEF